MNNSYLAYFHYGATCEGMTYVFGHVMAENPELAKKAFISKHMGGNDYTIEYFIQGVELIDLADVSNHERAKQLLKGWLTEDTIKYIFDAEKDHALFEFYFKTYVNYS